MKNSHLQIACVKNNAWHVSYYVIHTRKARKINKGKHMTNEATLSRFFSRNLNKLARRCWQGNIKDQSKQYHDYVIWKIELFYLFSKTAMINADTSAFTDKNYVMLTLIMWKGLCSDFVLLFFFILGGHILPRFCLFMGF